MRTCSFDGLHLHSCSLDNLRNQRNAQQNQFSFRFSCLFMGRHWAPLLEWSLSILKLDYCSKNALRNIDLGYCTPISFEPSNMAWLLPWHTTLARYRIGNAICTFSLSQVCSPSKFTSMLQVHLSTWSHLLLIWLDNYLHCTLQIQTN